jgi:hypothetical protein
MDKDKNQTMTDAAYVLNGSLNKIAAVMEEILRLVKEDQARSAAYIAKQKEEEDLD